MNLKTIRMFVKVLISYKNKLGEVSEWFMVPLSKSGLRFGEAWVRIPPSPQQIRRNGIEFGL